MGKLQFRGNWNQIRGKLKRRYGNLTDYDLGYVEGKEDELLERLERKIGKTKEQLAIEIKDL
jgi:uncharacterized protein YjbJ (UPF0337 family)